MIHQKIIGRGDACDLNVDDEYVSTKHAALIWDDSGHVMTVEDLGSTNGTFVNGRRIGARPVVLQLGDVVRVGRTEIPWKRAL